MAFDVSGLAAYVDESSDQLLAAAVESARSKSLTTMHTGIKGTQDIHLIANDLTYQNDGCELTASGDSTLTKVAMTVADIAVQMKYCQKDLIGKYTQRWLRAGSNGDLDEVTFLYNEIIQDLVKKIAAQEETNVWQGNTGGAGNLAFYDGWLKTIDAGSPINGNPTGITAATGITASNAISIMQGIYNVVPAALLGDESLAIMCGMDTFRVFQQALVNANLFSYNGEAVDTVNLPGTNVPIVGVNGLNGTNRIISTTEGHLHWGTDLESDEDELVVESGNTPGDKNFYVTSRFKSGTAVTYIGEIVEFTLVP